MTNISTNSALNFFKKYDFNKDGLNQQEVMVGAADNFNNIMSGLAYGNTDPNSLRNSFEQLVFATQAINNFDVFANASNEINRNDNPNTISILDLLKTASNDGDLRTLSSGDINSQGNQFMQQLQNYYNQQNPTVCYII